MNQLLLANQIHQFQGMRLLVIGDIGLDEYISGDASRLSPEAPVPVLDVHTEQSHLGLSGNVAHNIKSLGGEPLLLSVVGNDSRGKRISQLLESSEIDGNHLLVDESRFTTHKIRVMAQHHHLVRIDYETKKPLSEKTETLFYQKIEELLPSCAGIVLQDYAKGVVTPALVQHLVQIAHTQNKKVLLDPHRTVALQNYYGVDLMTPNHEEAFLLSGMASEDHHSEESLKEVAHRIMATVASDRLVITRGKQGMRLFETHREINLPTYAKKVFDVTGAGDTVISAIALSWLSGSSLQEACIIANHAAGIVVGKVGCVPCTLEELIESIQQESSFAFDPPNRKKSSS
jgi:rfaE bifunctional protein kinase chain/domain